MVPVNQGLCGVHVIPADQDRLPQLALPDGFIQTGSLRCLFREFTSESLAAESTGSTFSCQMGRVEFGVQGQGFLSSHPDPTATRDVYRRSAPATNSSYGNTGVCHNAGHNVIPKLHVPVYLVMLWLNVLQRY